MPATDPASGCGSDRSGSEADRDGSPGPLPIPPPPLAGAFSCRAGIGPAQVFLKD